MVTSFRVKVHFRNHISQPFYFCKGKRLEPQGFLRSVPDKFLKNSVTYCHKTICFIVTGISTEIKETLKDIRFMG